MKTILEYRKSAPLVDAAILVLLGILLWKFMVYVDLSDRFYEYSRAHEHWELDEIVLAVQTFGLMAFLYSMRWLIAARKEIARRRKAESDIAWLGQQRALEGGELVDRLRIPRTAAPLHAIEARLEGGIDPDQLEVLPTAPQDLDLDGMSHGVDRVVAVGVELGDELLRERPGPRAPPHLLPDLDHALPGLPESTRLQLVADGVREREGVEAARFEESDELSLARSVASGDSDDHGRHGP